MVKKVFKNVLIALALFSIVGVAFLGDDINAVSSKELVESRVIFVDIDKLYNNVAILDVDGDEVKLYYRYVKGLEVGKENYCDITKVYWRFGKCFYLLGDYTNSGIPVISILPQLLVKGSIL